MQTWLSFIRDQSDFERKHREGTEIVNSESTAAQQKIPRQQTDVSVTEEIRKMSIISTAM